MKEEFIFLTSVSDPECNLICQRLKEAGISYKLKDRPETAPFRIYGAHPILSVGRMIFVPVSELKRAKELLGIEDKDFSVKKWKIPLVIRIIIFIGLLVWLLLFILQSINFG